MKFNYHSQMEPAEFLALMDTVKYAITVIHELALANRASYTEDGGSSVDILDGADHFAPETEEAAAPAPVAAAPAPAAPVAVPEEFLGDKNTRLVKPVNAPRLAADHPLVSRGRKAFYNLIHIWRQGFGVEGVEQPDRVALMKSTMANEGGAVIAFLRFKGGLVAGTLDYFAASEFDTNAPEIRAEAIQIATNIGQVGSVVHPELTDMLEFVRPDGTIIPHVRYEQVRIPLAGEE